jgi:hypothetical protein
MERRKRFSKFPATALAILVGVAASQMVSAIEVAEISDFEMNDLPSPDPGGTETKKFRPKDWLEIEAGMKIPAQNREQLKTGFIDQIVVKWYVAMEEKASGRPMLLTKEVTHINLPVGEEIFTSVYLSPSTIKRLTGGDRPSKSDIEVAAIEVLVNGVKVGEHTSKMKSGWWQAPSLARGDQYPLLNKDETPFKLYWYDRYAEIQKER